MAINPECFAELLVANPIPKDVISEKGDVEPDVLTGSVQVIADPDRNGRKRLTRSFVQEQRTEGLVLLNLGPSYLLMSTIIEGRVTPRLHSHSKLTWKERNPGHDYRPRHVLALPGSVINPDEVNGCAEHQRFSYEPAAVEDWVSLERVHADWQEPTLASVAKPNQVYS